MLFPVLSTPLMTPDFGSTEATIKCVLAYTYGLEDCRIDVTLCEGTVILTGTAPSTEAVKMAIGVAADLCSRPVVSDIVITAPEGGCVSAPC